MARHPALAALGERPGLALPRAAGVRGESRVLGAQLSSGGGSTECPGGAETPCNGHGTCLDGIDRNGTCVCQENFGGSACQECQDPERFGPDCQSVCNCVHGVCRNGPLGDGSCLCFAGYTGPHCDQELPVCQALSCPQNSQCSAEAPTCSCLPGHTLQGSKCQAADPCRP